MGFTNNFGKFKKCLNRKGAIIFAMFLGITFLYTTNVRPALPSKFILNDTLSWFNDVFSSDDNFPTNTGKNSQSPETEELHLPKPLFYDLNYPTENFPASSFVRDHFAPQEKLILFYTKEYGQNVLGNYEQTKGNLVIDPKMANHTCPSKCSYTEDKSMIDVADAVAFSVFDTEYMSTSPSNYPKLDSRKQNQMWIGFVFETSIYHWVGNVPIDKLYNWTATYRLDSDLYWTYGYFYKPEVPPHVETTLSTEMLQGKTKFAASLISNCWTRSNREGVISSLKQFIPIDSYGSCGDTKCPDDSKCRKFIGQNYKFFLAFENSFCQDYVTEKFFECFSHNLVPITYGLGDYTEIAPPNSYINALDFPSTKALADYLIYLDKNDNEYLKYFEWKREYVQDTVAMWEKRLCTLCLKLWEPLEPKQISGGFNQWWRHKRPTNKQINNATLGKLLLDNAQEQCVSLDEINRVLSENNFLSV